MRAACYERKRRLCCWLTLTDAQCSIRDFGCTLLICITLASCIIPFSSTVISKGCLKSPTEKKNQQ